MTERHRKWRPGYMVLAHGKQWLQHQGRWYAVAEACQCEACGAALEQLLRGPATEIRLGGVDDPVGDEAVARGAATG
jgi:hypothetical protein